MTFLLIVALIALAIGLGILAKSLKTKTAFVSLTALVFIVSFLMAFKFTGFWSGVIITVIISLPIIVLDDIGILA